MAGTFQSVHGVLCHFKGIYSELSHFQRKYYDQIEVASVLHTTPLPFNSGVAINGIKRNSPIFTMALCSKWICNQEGEMEGEFAAIEFKFYDIIDDKVQVVNIQIC